MTPTPLRILVVDDNQSGADALKRLLGRMGHDADAVYDGATAIQEMQGNTFDIVLTDLRMEPVDGMEVLRTARSLALPPEVIVFTAYGAVDVAVEAMRLGARDFMTKPVTVEQIASRFERIGQERSSSRTGVSAPQPFIATSPAATTLLQQLNAVAKTPSATLLHGEVGTGRVFCARTLHHFAHDGASDIPLMVHHAPLTDWPVAGTVVLSNVDTLPIERQRQCVAVLHDKPDNVRVLSTASPDFRRRLDDGEFLSELYFRLAVVEIHVPPLRERTEDIVPLFTQAFQDFARRFHTNKAKIDGFDLSELERRRWPGNLRELRNMAERAVIFGMEALAPPATTRREPRRGPPLGPGFSLSDHLDTIERNLILEALRRSKGDRNGACLLLGVERNTLRYKLKKYDLL